MSTPARGADCTLLTRCTCRATSGPKTALGRSSLGPGTRPNPGLVQERPTSHTAAIDGVAWDAVVEQGNLVDRLAAVLNAIVSQDILVDHQAGQAQRAAERERQRLERFERLRGSTLNENRKILQEDVGPFLNHP